MCAQGINPPGSWSAECDSGCRLCRIGKQSREVTGYVFIGAHRDLEALEGINRPWLYVGGLGSSFAAHQEDCTLTGVNYMVDTSACHVDLTAFKAR